MCIAQILAKNSFDGTIVLNRQSKRAKLNITSNFINEFLWHKKISVSQIFDGSEFVLYSKSTHEQWIKVVQQSWFLLEKRDCGKELVSRKLSYNVHSSLENSYSFSFYALNCIFFTFTALMPLIWRISKTKKKVIGQFLKWRHLDPSIGLDTKLHLSGIIPSLIFGPYKLGLLWSNLTNTFQQVFFR